MSILKSISKHKIDNIQYLLFRSFIIFALLLSLIFTLVNYLNTRPLANIISGIVSAVICSLALLLARNQEKYQISRIIFLVYFTFILVPLGYITSPGSYSAMLYLIVLIMFMTTIVPIKKWEYIFSILIIIQTPFLLRSELWFPDWYYKYADETYRINDITINYMVVLIAIFLITYFMMTRYDRHNKNLYKISVTDSLTNLYNRRYFFDFANMEHNRSKRSDKHYVIVFIDLNHFKQINDFYGHLTGDLVLKEIADIIINNIRSYDIAARYGGDEFIIILPSTEMSDAESLIERMQVKFKAYSLQYTKQNFNVGFGVASSEGRSLEETIKQADESLYIHKNNLKESID
jgi:diguanylate cyclase (GGDEF)-like protein